MFRDADIGSFILARKTVYRYKRLRWMPFLGMSAGTFDKGRALNRSVISVAMGAKDGDDGAQEETAIRECGQKNPPIKRKKSKWYFGR